jgi:hypothetical protein
MICFIAMVFYQQMCTRVSLMIWQRFWPRKHCYYSKKTAKTHVSRLPKLLLKYLIRWNMLVQPQYMNWSFKICPFSVSSVSTIVLVIICYTLSCSPWLLLWNRLHVIIPKNTVFIR